MESILIVDDLPENRYLLEVLFKERADTVLTAANGKEALAVARRHPPDIVITDILMPEMDGFALCRAWKGDAQLRSIPFVFYTATYTESKDEDFALSLGADMFLRKPMQPDLFVERIQAVIDRMEKAPQPAKAPIIRDEEESYKRYSERLINKLEKKLLDLEVECDARRKAEEALRASMNEWEETFHAIGSPALLLDADFTIIHANRFATAQLGAAESELVGKKCFEAMHAADAPHEQCPMERMLREGTGTHSDGEIDINGRSYLVNCSPLKNLSGEIEKIIHISVDITDRKRAEVRLRESEERFRRLADNARDVIYRMKIPEGTYDFVSPASSDLFGYSPEEFYASPALFKETLHPDWIAYFDEQWENLKAGRMPQTYEYQIIHRDGDARWLNQRNVLVSDDEGRPLAIEGIVTDITARKAVEFALKESEEKFRQLVENIHEIFWIRDAADHTITYISPMFETVYQMPVERMYADPLAFMQHVLPADRAAVTAAHRAEVEEGRQTDVVFRARIEGQIRWIRSRGFPVHDEKGQILWIAGVAEDITEKHQAEVKRKQLEDQLMHTQKIEALGTLAGGIAHDFNNILASIIGYAELSLDELDPGSLAYDNANEVLTAGKRARDLVKQILTLAQRSEDESKPVIVSRLVKEALKLIRASVPSSIEIQQEITSQSLVMAPPAQIHQVLMNLLTNAAQAVGDGGGTISVSVADHYLRTCPVARHRPFTPGNYIRIEIADTGSGIPDTAMAHIFDPYFTTKAVGEGSGLGLSITNGIVQNYGGHIRVDSRVGRGTTFTVYLPITLQREMPRQRMPAPAPGSGRVLLVDDEEKIVQLMDQVLSKHGYTVTRTTRSTEALEIFRDRPGQFDLVITDMTMPAMTGDRLAAALREIRDDIPIILCTGFSHKLGDKAPADLGVAALLMKPVAIDALLRAAAEALAAAAGGPPQR